MEMKKVFADAETEVNDLHIDQVKALLEHLRDVCNYSDDHLRKYTKLIGIFQKLNGNPDNQAWKKLHRFLLNSRLPISRRNNATWIILGLFGHLVGQPSFSELVNDCIYVLLKNMTIGVQLGQVSPNVCYYENLDVDSAVKQPGIALFAILGLYMPVVWPICCRQLQRMINEGGGLLKPIKLLIGLFDYRHSGEFKVEKTKECVDLVQNIIARSGSSKVLSLYVHWIKQAYIPYKFDEEAQE